MLEHLFSEGFIGSLKLKNRIVMPPMVTRFSQGGFVTDRLVNYYKKRAEGGVGLIVVEAAYVIPQDEERLSIADDNCLPGLKRLVRTIHKAGAQIALEINIGRGRAARHAPVAASSNSVAGITPRALAVSEIEYLIMMYTNGAKRAKEAEFDAIMIHGAHGYLVSDFLSPRLNKRSDQYGGNVKNRARLALELVRATKKTNTDSYPVIFRLSASERVQGGISLGEVVQICKYLHKEGVDAVDVTSGSIGSFENQVPDMSYPRGYNIELSEQIKKSVDLTVMVAGRINDPYLGDDIVRHGKADFIDFGRLSIADPGFAQKARVGESEMIRPCLACLRCIESFKKAEPLVCTVNPDIGSEYDSEEIAPTGQRKKVLVIGGGPAGLTAASEAARLGHQVTLWEKENSLGGQLLLAMKPPFKEELQNLLRYLRGLAQKTGVNISLKKHATAKDINSFHPDAVVVATGSVPKPLTLEGEEQNNVANVREVLSGSVLLGRKVVIIGGGIVGCELAEMLSVKNCQVALVEVLDELASDTADVIKTPLLKRLRQEKIEIYTSCIVQSINPQGVVIETNNKDQSQVKADQIIISVGCVPDCTLWDALVGDQLEVYKAGDCREPRRFLEAIHEGIATARAL